MLYCWNYVALHMYNNIKYAITVQYLHKNDFEYALMKCFAYVLTAKGNLDINVIA